MVSTGKTFGVEHMSSITHSLHLVVAGKLIKKKKVDAIEEPAWLADIAAEVSEDIAEHEEETSLASEDRDTIEGYHELAIAKMDRYLDETTLGAPA
ncbi:hypothetical protein PHYPSEUDO_013644 [Phytophthora pseudosyringae]|uniref:Uncharacterized protein n=1 Tax=Phytophthora pseudosyringae TaxID=221518 RepID=A0A8T1V628_9STRA|nr:hypothetical protein PHYPSEUDO_013644 [Phytophthora pseudosyringae]